jgi:hypothetical protein
MLQQLRHAFSYRSRCLTCRQRQAGFS